MKTQVPRFVWCLIALVHCKLDFPVCLESKLKWSPTVYDKLSNGTVVVKDKTFSEILVVTLVKKICC